MVTSSQEVGRRHIPPYFAFSLRKAAFSQDCSSVLSTKYFVKVFVMLSRLICMGFESNCYRTIEALLQMPYKMVSITNILSQIFVRSPQKTYSVSVLPCCHIRVGEYLILFNITSLKAEPRSM